MLTLLQEGKIDGCALFYRPSRFKLTEYFVVEFNDVAEGMVGFYERCSCSSLSCVLCFDQVNLEIGKLDASVRAGHCSPVRDLCSITSLILFKDICTVPVFEQADYTARVATFRDAAKRLMKDNVAQVALLEMHTSPGPKGQKLDTPVRGLCVTSSK
jgi:hypothetical protein